MDQDLKERFARRIHRIGVFKDKSRSPEGKGFKLRLHETHPEEPLSPFYLDFRLLQSDFESKDMAICLFMEMVNELEVLPDRLAAIPEAIVPVVSSLSDVMKIPMITPRGSKGHGSGAKVDGIYSFRQTAALFDDLITGADSKLASATILWGVGLRVEDVFVLVDRQQGGAELLVEAGLRLHSAFLLDELLGIYMAQNMMADEIYAEIQAYRGPHSTQKI